MDSSLVINFLSGVRCGERSKKPNTGVLKIYNENLNFVKGIVYAE